MILQQFDVKSTTCGLSALEIYRMAFNSILKKHLMGSSLDTKARYALAQSSGLTSRNLQENLRVGDREERLI